MATELKSISEKIHWPLLAKSVLLGLLWLFVPLWLFFLLAVYFYFVPNFNSLKLLRSFVMFLGILAISPIVSFPLLYVWAGVVVFFTYLLLGVKDLILIHRQIAYQVMRFLLALASFLLFFWWGQAPTANFVWQWFALFFVLYALYREFLSFVLLEEPREKMVVSAALSALLLFEVSWVLAWLPIGFLNATAIAVLTMFMVDDFTIHHFKGDLSSKKFLSNFTIFVFSLLIIFALSDWSIQ